MVATLPADHRRGRVRVHGDGVGHDRGVRNTQPGDAMDAEGGVNHRVCSDAHAAGADGVEPGADIARDVCRNLGIVADRGSREMLAGVPRGEGRPLRDLPTEANGTDHDLHVVRMAEVARVDLEWSIGIGSGQADRTPAPGASDPRNDREAWHTVIRLGGEVWLLGERDLDVTVGAIWRRAGEGATFG